LDIRVDIANTATHPQISDLIDTQTLTSLCFCDVYFAYKYPSRYRQATFSKSIIGSKGRVDFLHAWWLYIDSKLVAD